MNLYIYIYIHKVISISIDIDIDIDAVQVKKERHATCDLPKHRSLQVPQPSQDLSVSTVRHDSCGFYCDLFNYPKTLKP